MVHLFDGHRFSFPATDGRRNSVAERLVPVFLTAQRLGLYSFADNLGMLLQTGSPDSYSASDIFFPTTFVAYVGDYNSPTAVIDYL